VLLAVSWIAALIFGVVWGAVAWISRYSSLAGLTASGLTPVVLAFLVGGKAALVFAALTALVWYMHRANIQRLMAGTESKIGQSKTAAPEA
jgi:glycerol-3-phosphate acyltransferase PlsY